VVEDEVLSNGKAEIRVGDTLLDNRRVRVHIKRPHGRDQQADDERQQPKNSSNTTEQRHIDHRSTSADDHERNINKSQLAPRSPAAPQNASRRSSAAASPSNSRPRPAEC